MSHYADQLLRRIEAIDTAAADNRRRTEAYQQMSDELKEVTGTASSPDGVVTVVAGPGGEVKSVSFGERVRDLAPAALAASVTHTIAAARAEAAKQQAEVVRHGLGDSDLLDKVLDSDEQIFGAQRPGDPGPPPPGLPPEPEQAPYQYQPQSAPQPQATPRPAAPRPGGASRGAAAHEDDYFEGFNVLGGGPGR
ncbi:YbaB/EbfC family nucleoid-associated protein [Amycolatopsis sp. K13G38]|uniref:YbaB/EbfC family nucleoid-associated protein n=1 Tax=Amycolatopsis acididurans TaxID=2724524 RepID=A0ABX1J9U3_9PSEU|nr:YbaB/EbfC family nucleoid-associated protein [Amycolatopsis acididurans]NKQ56468.1 YbaB/EbfC family nucleoid-associated protein [Amycolatopsis acididurans]